METIGKRADEYAAQIQGEGLILSAVRHGNYHGYIQGATDQKKIDIEITKKAFKEAVGWCAIYPRYKLVYDKFIKALEGEEFV